MRLFTGSTETTHPPSFAYIGLGTCPAPPSNSGLGWRCTRPTCPLFGSVSGSAEPVSGWVPAGPTVTFQGAGLTQRQPALTGASLMRSLGRRGERSLWPPPPCAGAQRLWNLLPWRLQHLRLKGTAQIVAARSFCHLDLVHSCSRPIAVPYQHKRPCQHSSRSLPVQQQPGLFCERSEESEARLCHAGSPLAMQGLLLSTVPWRVYTSVSQAS